MNKWQLTFRISSYAIRYKASSEYFFMGLILYCSVYYCILYLFIVFSVYNTPCILIFHSGTYRETLDQDDKTEFGHFLVSC